MAAGYKLDLHSHSEASPDGGISTEQYKEALLHGTLDTVAITDHNRIDFALRIQQQLPEKIIVGEEIMTSAGEIIGLFLKKPIPPGLSPYETVDRIKSQMGVVYIPHPFETYRKGLHPSILDELVDYIDIIEVKNGRAFFQNRGEQAVVWAKLNHVLAAAGSDAHGAQGLGNTFIMTEKLVSRDNILQQLSSGRIIAGKPKIRSLLYPKYHRLRKKLGGQI